MPGSRSPWSRRSAGSMSDRKPTMLESGLPGRPKTSVAPCPPDGEVVVVRRPKNSGLPGLTRTRPKTSSTPHASNAGRTWSCGPTDTPPETTSTPPPGPAPHPPAQPRLDRGARGLEVVGDDAVLLDDRAGTLRQQPHHQPVRLVDLPRLGRRAERQQLGPGDDEGQARAAM